MMNHRILRLIPTTVLCGLLFAFAVGSASAEKPAPCRGQVEFRVTPGERNVPKQFHLEPHTFPFEQKPMETSSRAFELSSVTFPSAVVTAEANNNIVDCEYFRPVGPGKYPGVVVLHILGGDFELSRLFARSLVHRGAAALFLRMPYYGPRRQPGSAARMVSADPRETVRGMTQAVLDIRRGAAWLAAQDEVDPEQLGVLGVSLGGITAALAATAEPKLERLCLILAGGGMGNLAWDSPHLAKVREHWSASGGTRESLAELLKTVDPVTYGANVRGRKILMLNARNDEIIPPACTLSLWEAFGKPPIVWWDATHYTAATYIFVGLDKATRFFVPAQKKSATAPPAR